jgi:hypothetical protein
VPTQPALAFAVDEHEPPGLHESRTDREQLAGRLIETAERWADACISDRGAAIT